MKVKTYYDPPPIPLDSFNWSAVDDETYDGDGPVGYGETEFEAIIDLFQKTRSTERSGT